VADHPHRPCPEIQPSGRRWPRWSSARTPGLGLILLPIMIYHPLQLIVCSIMAEAYSSKRDAAPKDAGLVSAR